METSHAPIEVFYSCSDSKRDAPLLEFLESHLGTLKQNNVITTWHKRQIVAGSDWQREVDHHLKTAALILLLISPDFLASGYQYGVELQLAMERHNKHEARVIPILLRPCDWENTPFRALQVVPRNEKPITSWRNRDEAWVDVVQNIRAVLKGEGKTEPPASKASRSVQVQKKSAHALPFPPIWNVPYRYAGFFTGRDQVVERLFDRFIPDALSGLVAPWALTGLGGLGKTQTAVTYAYRHRTTYQSVLWTRAETEADLVTGFTNMAQLLALPAVDLRQRESVLDGMQKWFASHTDWLLILDNADDFGMVRPFLPLFPTGHVLLTSRVAATGQEAQSLELLPLPPDKGALCLLRRANYIPWTGQLQDAPSSASVKAAHELSERMGGLPLALEQAGAYIETTGRGVGGYLELYKKYRPEIQQHYYGDVRSYRETVASTWSIARESVEIANPAANELLFLCAFLAPDAIPYTLFPDDARILGPILGPEAAHPLRLDQLVTLLRRHSLLQKQADRDTDISQIFIHRVLQEVLRDSMDPETQRLWAERAVRIVALALPEREWSMMQPHVQACYPFIEQWKMSSREADIIRQWVEAKHL
jgi:hypothetical protein